MQTRTDTPTLSINTRTQTMVLRNADRADRSYRISTALNGTGSLKDSQCTPLGLHRIRLKIGASCPSGTVFVARRPTGEIHDPNSGANDPDRDWILSRILWLEGMEPGRNRGGNVDTLRRFIYIHGTAAEASIGTACSHGCIRMTNADVIDLFERVRVGTPVLIHCD